MKSSFISTGQIYEWLDSFCFSAKVSPSIGLMILSDLLICPDVDTMLRLHMRRSEILNHLHETDEDAYDELFLELHCPPDISLEWFSKSDIKSDIFEEIDELEDYYEYRAHVNEVLSYWGFSGVFIQRFIENLLPDTIYVNERFNMRTSRIFEDSFPPEPMFFGCHDAHGKDFALDDFMESHALELMGQEFERLIEALAEEKDEDCASTEAPNIGGWKSFLEKIGENPEPTEWSSDYAPERPVFTLNNGAVQVYLANRLEESDEDTDGELPDHLKELREKILAGGVGPGHKAIILYPRPAAHLHFQPSKEPKQVIYWGEVLLGGKSFRAVIDQIPTKFDDIARSSFEASKGPDRMDWQRLGHASRELIGLWLQEMLRSGQWAS